MAGSVSPLASTKVEEASEGQSYQLGLEAARSFLDAQHTQSEQHGVHGRLNIVAERPPLWLTRPSA